MAGHPPPEGVGDDFLEQILSMPLYGGGSAGGGVERNLADLVLHQGSRQGGHVSSSSALGGAGFPFLGGGVFQMDRRTVEGGGSGGSEEFLDAAARGASPAKAVCDGQGPPESLSVEPHSMVPRPRARAKRGQSTNPHSIAERLRRERIAERMRALQELVPSCNKTDRAAMVDEIVDYVKFLRLQVKVLSMSRLGGAGASAEADIPVMPLQGEASEDESNQQVWERWSTGDSTEQQVAKLMEEDVGAAMQFLQSNALCIVPISLAASICNLHDQPGTPSAVKPDPGAPS